MSKKEFFRVCLFVKPMLTWEEYEIMWKEFVARRELWNRRN